MVEASIDGEARDIIRADLDVDPGSYDEHPLRKFNNVASTAFADSERVLALSLREFTPKHWPAEL
jgi:hypothetical protein